MSEIKCVLPWGIEVIHYFIIKHRTIKIPEDKCTVFFDNRK